MTSSQVVVRFQRHLYTTWHTAATCKCWGILLSSSRHLGPALNSSPLGCGPDTCLAPLWFARSCGGHLASNERTWLQTTLPPPGPAPGLLLLVLGAVFAAMVGLCSGKGIGEEGEMELSLWQNIPSSEVGGETRHCSGQTQRNQGAAGVWDACSENEILGLWRPRATDPKCEVSGGAGHVRGGF